MADFAGKFKSAKQDWETPQVLFKAVDAIYRFDFDLAASAENTKCSRYFTEFDDAMKQKWAGRCWLNPPYGEDASPLSDWVRKAYEESIVNREMFVVMLVPARTNTRWFHDFCMKGRQIHLICGRPKFVGAEHGLPQPLCLVEFRHVEEKQRATFSSLFLPASSVDESERELFHF